MNDVLLRQLRLSLRSQLAIAAAILLLVLGAVVFTSNLDRGGASAETDLTNPAKREAGKFYPTAAQWAALTVQPIEQYAFRSEFVTEGKIAIDENRATRIFSPYAGRVKRLLLEPGDVVQQGQLIFVIEAADSVETQKEFVAAIAGVNQARSHAHPTPMGQPSAAH